MASAPLLIRDIAYGDTFAAFRRFADLPGAVFLDSAQAGAPFGRYSFIAADPFLTLASRDGRITCGDESWEGDPFAALSHRLAQHAIEPHPGLPPFQGGVAGWFAYDLGRHLERLPAHRVDDQPVADLMLGFYDLVLAFDHEARRGWAIASGLRAETRGRIDDWLATRLRDKAAELAARYPADRHARSTRLALIRKSLHVLAITDLGGTLEPAERQHIETIVQEAAPVSEVVRF